MLAASVPDTFSIAGTCSSPVLHASQLNTPDSRLHLGHPPVGAKALMHPTKPRRMLTLIHRIPTLAVILVRPHLRPQLPVIGRHHAALTTGAHDLVLTE